MAHVNGTATYESLSPPIIPVASENGRGPGEHLTPERIAEIRERLAEPFDPGAIKWRVTATSTKQTKQGR